MPLLRGPLSLPIAVAARRQVAREVADRMMLVKSRAWSDNVHRGSTEDICDKRFNCMCSQVQGSAHEVSR